MWILGAVFVDPYPAASIYKFRARENGFTGCGKIRFWEGYDL